MVFKSIVQGDVYLCTGVWERIDVLSPRGSNQKVWRGNTLLQWSRGTVVVDVGSKGVINRS